MKHDIQCLCGAFRGHLQHAEDARRAICYCKDCRAYAYWLGQPQRTLDRLGGTELVAALPHRVHFDQGVEQLRCVSLTPKGPLRWYAACCRSPIGNTARHPGLPFVSLVATCLQASPSERDRDFGPVRIALNTESAEGDVSATKVAVVLGVMRIMRKALGARLGGSWKRNPFFRTGSSEPLSKPEAVSKGASSVLPS